MQDPSTFERAHVPCGFLRQLAGGSEALLQQGQGAECGDTLWEPLF